jgi:hypothetical protein
MTFYQPATGPLNGTFTANNGKKGTGHLPGSAPARDDFFVDDLLHAHEERSVRHSPVELFYNTVEFIFQLLFIYAG